jgi:hypothetical protein
MEYLVIFVMVWCWFNTTESKQHNVIFFNMSKFLPLENIIFKTKLSKEEVIQNLKNHIEAQKSFGFGSHKHNYSKPYIGEIVGNNFEIKRVIDYRNSFLPTIKGEVYSELDGTKIKINMKPPTFILTFMSIWFGGVLIGCLASLISLITSKFSPFFFIPFVMLFFGIVLVYGTFKSESATSKKDLMKFLEAEIEK